MHVVYTFFNLVERNVAGSGTGHAATRTEDVIRTVVCFTVAAGPARFFFRLNNDTRFEVAAVNFYADDVIGGGVAAVVSHAAVAAIISITVDIADGWANIDGVTSDEDAGCHTVRTCFIVCSAAFVFPLKASLNVDTIDIADRRNIALIVDVAGAAVIRIAGDVADVQAYTQSLLNYRNVDACITGTVI